MFLLRFQLENSTDRSTKHKAPLRTEAYTGVNGDRCSRALCKQRSRAARYKKGTMNHTNIDIQAMLVWLIVPFLIIFAVFDPSPLILCINCSFFYIYCKYALL